MKKFKFFVFIGFLLIVLCIVYFLTNTFIEPKAYDFMTKHIMADRLPFDTKKQVYGSDDVVLIVIDAKTVEKYRWPWKREEYCKIFGYLQDYTKTKIAIHDAILVTLDKENPTSDKAFFNTVKNYKNMIVGFMPRIQDWENQTFGDAYDEKFAKKFALKLDGSTSQDIFYGSMMTYPDEFMASVNNVGSVSMFPGAINGNITVTFDEVYRTHEYLIKYKGHYYPSLAMETFLLLNDNPKLQISNSEIYFPELNYKIKQKTTFYQSIVPVRFYKLSNGYSHRTYSAVDIMDSYELLRKGKAPIINPSEFDNKIVVVGANVPAGVGLNDNKNSPISVNHPGVDYQATAIDNIIHNDFLSVVPEFINLLITLIGMLFVFLIIRKSDLYKSIILTIGVIFLYLIFSSLCFYYKIIVAIATPVVMFIMTMIVAYIDKFILENRSKEKVKSAMGKYMSEDVMKRVMQNIDNLGLGGKKSTVTVLFSDIRGFTSISENLSAQQVSEILNEYFTEMEPIVTKNNGIINKFIGDAVMAVFGEPIQDENHPLNAVKCAYEMLLKVFELQKKWEKEGKPKIDIGIGINTGEVFVGNIGSVNRMEYTVIGDTVNLASRLEGYNKLYNTKILISSSTYETVKNFVEAVKFADVEIRGKAHKIDIYEIVKVK